MPRIPQFSANAKSVQRQRMIFTSSDHATHLAFPMIHFDMFLNRSSDSYNEHGRHPRIAPLQPPATSLSSFNNASGTSSPPRPSLPKLPYSLQDPQEEHCYNMDFARPGCSDHASCPLPPTVVRVRSGACLHLRRNNRSFWHH
jgi:hypothetical protein